MLILGIDDAGRGPLIGDMFLAGVIIDDEIEAEFREKGVKDSKKLTDMRREILAEVVKAKAMAYEILSSSPAEIDSGINLNTLEAQKAGEIINLIDKKTQGMENIKVVVDCPSPNLEAWKKTLLSYVDNPGKFNFFIEHKADVNYIACSAASILAKSTREKHVAELKKKLGVDFGSGYPADPVTCKFLKDYATKHEKDGIFRKTWSTWKDNCSSKKQKKLDV